MRSKTIEVRVSPGEWKMAKAQARKSGCSLSALIRLRLGLMPGTLSRQIYVDASKKKS